MDLPIYDITLEDYNTGLFAISLVDEPATESKFVYMSKDETTWRFSNEEKGEVIGALIVPDKLIYRNIGGQEFYVKFSADVIAQINERMQETGFNKFFTVQHELAVESDAVKFLESWIKETEEDKSNAFGINEPVGTLFAKAKINSDFIKQNIKEGKLNGFSIELDASLIKENFNKINNDKNKEMNYKEIYSNSLVVDDKELLFSGELVKGSVVFEYTKDEDGKESIAPYTGEFKNDNVQFTIKDGLVTGVEDINLTLAEKIDSLSEKLEGLKTELSSDIKNDEKNEELAESVKGLAEKLEEAVLLMKQKEAKSEEQEPENKEMKFSADAYKAVSEWVKRFKENK
jgi:hypothetical protein